MTDMTIWVDADATPNDVKDVIYRAAMRLEIPTVLVANQRITTPVNNPHVSTILVAHGPDVADGHIVESAFEGDLAITADIPLAAALVERGVQVLDHRGEEYTPENVRERLSVRDFMDSLRGTGVETGGPKAYSAKDKRAFADALDRTLTASLRKQARARKKRKGAAPPPRPSPPPSDTPWIPTTSQGAVPMPDAPACDPPRPAQRPDEAMRRLRQGNERFAGGQPTRSAVLDAGTRAALATQQHPIAIVLTCSDHRVVPEDIFDQPPGELFVARVAGNVAPPETLGSIEFAAEVFGSRLIVVLGHTSCGAVGATVRHIRQPSGTHSPGVRSLIERIEGPARASGAEGSATSEEELLAAIDTAVDANARSVAAELLESEKLGALAEQDGLRIVSAVYSMSDGTVDFHDIPTRTS